MEDIEAVTAALTAAAMTDDVEERLALLTLARADLDAAVAATVAEARALGCSWARIGNGLGVSRQAAQARFANAVDPTPAEPAAPRTERPRVPTPRAELIALSTPGGRPLLRLRVDRMPVADARQPARR